MQTDMSRGMRKVTRTQRSVLEDRCSPVSDPVACGLSAIAICAGICKCALATSTCSRLPRRQVRAQGLSSSASGAGSTELFRNGASRRLILGRVAGAGPAGFRAPRCLARYELAPKRRCIMHCNRTSVLSRPALIPKRRCRMIQCSQISAISCPTLQLGSLLPGTRKLRCRANQTCGIMTRMLSTLSWTLLLGTYKLRFIASQTCGITTRMISTLSWKYTQGG